MNPSARHVERWISFTLRFGVWTSAAFMITGLAISALQGDHTLATTGPTLGQLTKRLFSGELDGFTIMSLGLFLLMFTPFLRVLAALAGFVSLKDWTFAGISAAVLTMLVGGLVYSLV